ncbi:conserved hypothetical protein [Paraburkholderia piptadeniae]|uniref:Uncharacterized protein n=1 Tax=Paraburkholderia piptadeniae TaxID=1701573 RepID=A0A1N7SFW0_9BURK|nr:hypothetical protein [Paraburkholderia piptadeniae]SIT46285.1 conserved hypothetical protein [Paraburkholderia piptadeniae]
MDRYWKSNAAAAPPAVPANSAAGFPADGDPSVGVEGTVPGAWWYHTITEELRNAIVKLGGTPDYSKLDQLANAIASSISAAISEAMSDLAKVATSGSYADLSSKPHIPADPVNADWNASTGLAQILNRPSLAKVATSGQYGDLAGTPPAYALPPATTTKLGGIIAGSGTTVAADGTLSAKPSLIVNVAPAANVALDLTPIVQGAPEILFNLPVASGASTTLSIINPPAAGTLAEFVLVVNNSANSAIVWPSSIKWPQGVAPLLCGVAGKLDTFVIYTQDGGATYCGFTAGQNQ